MSCVCYQDLSEISYQIRSKEDKFRGSIKLITEFMKVLFKYSRVNELILNKKKKILKHIA